jgi:hypothetical protein
MEELEKFVAKHKRSPKKIRGPQSLQEEEEARVGNSHVLGAAVWMPGCCCWGSREGKNKGQSICLFALACFQVYNWLDRQRRTATTLNRAQKARLNKTLRKIGAKLKE